MFELPMNNARTENCRTYISLVYSTVHGSEFPMADTGKDEGPLARQAALCIYNQGATYLKVKMYSVSTLHGPAWRIHFSIEIL